MTKTEMKHRIKDLERELEILQTLFVKHIQGLKEKHLLTNDRIDEAFFILKELEKKMN
jgi:hypothetical protein